jgi:hypothetical protein
VRPSLPDLVTDVLAVHRLTRLVTKDTLLHEPREAIIEASYTYTVRLPPNFETWAELAEADGPDAPKVATLITCRWCTSVWLAAGVVALRRLIPGLWGPMAQLLAASSVSTLLAGLEQD